MHTSQEVDIPDGVLHPLNEAIQQVVPGTMNPATHWRWITRGIAGLNGDRIRLQVWYVGRSPRTTVAAVRTFIEAVTAARLARMARTQERAADVTDEELEAVGLSGRRQ